MQGRVCFLTWLFQDLHPLVCLLRLVSNKSVVVGGGGGGVWKDRIEHVEIL